jgi:hypothetical protein
VIVRLFHRRVIEMTGISLSSEVTGDHRRTSSVYAETAHWSSTDVRFLHFEELLRLPYYGAFLIRPTIWQTVPVPR